MVEAGGERQRRSGARSAGGWAGSAVGMVEAEGELLLLVDLEALIAGPGRREAA